MYLNTKLMYYGEVYLYMKNKTSLLNFNHLKMIYKYLLKTYLNISALHCKVQHISNTVKY